MTDKNQRLLEKGLEKLGIPFTQEAMENVREYLNLYHHWNQKISLSSIQKESDIILRHFLDSLSPFELFKEKPFWQRKNCIDLGSGTGFPGLAWKLFFPSIQIDLAEVEKKKFAF